MTEKDNISRVFLSSGGKPSAWEVYPEYTDHDLMLKGLEAVAVLQRVDYSGTYIWEGKFASDSGKSFTDKEGFWFTDRSSGEHFYFSTKDWGWEYKNGPKSYKRIAEELEKKFGKTGLTIVLR